MLGKGGWTEAESKRRPKGDAKKGRLAARLRAETTMTWSWIAARLNMGHWRTALNATQAALLKGGAPVIRRNTPLVLSDLCYGVLQNAPQSAHFRLTFRLVYADRLDSEDFNRLIFGS